MARAERTDIHRPSTIVPDDYEYVFSYCLTMTEEGPVDYDGISMLQELHALEGVKFVEGAEESRCTVCSTPMQNGQVWLHRASGEHLYVGRDCAATYALVADMSADELRIERGKKNAKRSLNVLANRKRYDAFCAKHPGLAEALEAEHHISQDLRSKLLRFGSMSEKQIALALKIPVQEAERAAKKAAELLANPTTPAPQGAVEFEGLVVATRSEKSQFSYDAMSYKMLVRVDTEAGHYKVWMTVPASLLSDETNLRCPRMEALKGCRVALKATLTQSQDDASFALAKRPRGKVVAYGPASLPEQEVA